VEEGEKPTKYFSNLEKRNYEKKTISQIKLNNGQKTTDPQLIQKEIESYFSRLYKTKICDSARPQQTEVLQNFIETLDLPKLIKNPKLIISDEEQTNLEHELTPEEIKNTLLSFQNNKTPGEDGFIKEFYEMFFDTLCSELLNSYKEAFRNGKYQFHREEALSL